ncbi:MAG TPA: CsbD family protein [Anaeromyxobacteraceae bacterium]|nr:CsbD family protein [Anaeromyxobacteraceae bacterium]
MNRDELKGKMKEIKGDVKERLGGASRDRSTQAEGFVERHAGKLQKNVGKTEREIDRERDPTRDPTRNA